MSQLVVRPGRNAARQAKKLKEIRKTKYAIQWHERERKKRQELMQERWESKQAVLHRILWENDNIKGVRKRALAYAKEDWKLGPLRPNRAVGGNADKYGAITSSQVQKPDISAKTQQNRNAVREKKGLELEYPLVFDDKKYFPIVKNDRVVILKGKDAGKIGIVQDIIPRTHDVIVKNLNMQYFDSKVFSAANEGVGPKHPNEVPLPLDHVRLVIPSEINQGGAKRYKDVIVEKIFMERHTTGIDPYTGTDYGSSEIPKEHQYDPRNGLPIFHRYISGTNHRIEWPWEREEWTEDVDVTNEHGTDNRSWLRKTMSTIAQPFSGLDRWRSSNKQIREQQDSSALKTDDIEENFAKIEKEQQDRFKTQPPRSKDLELPEAYDDVDTTRNIVERSESMSYILVSPPFPDTLGEELRDDIHDLSIKAKKEQDPQAPRVKIARHSKQGALAQEIAKRQKQAAEAMKTPMQLRWELEQRKKAEALRKQPLVDQETLLAALGQHMQKKAVKPYLGKKQIAAQNQHLD